MYNGWGSIYWDSSVGDTAAWGLYLQSPPNVGVADQPLVDEFTTNYIVGGEALCLAPNFDNYTSEMGAISGITSPSNGSAEFNGTSDYIQIEDNGKGSAFDTQTFTISAWVNAKTLGDNVIWSYDFTSHSAPYYAQQLRLLAGGNVYFSWNNGSILQDLQTSGGGFYSENDWLHIAVTFGNNSQKMYLDGSEVRSGSSTATITYYNQEVWIGKANFGGEFDGNMANVAFWNRALTSDEINSVMWKQYEEISTSERNGLQAWYSLDSVDSFDWYTYAQNQGAVIEGRTCVDNALNALAQL